MNQANAYAAFMLDYVAGTLSPGERLAADLHCALSAAGGREARLAEAVGGVLLEAGAGRDPAALAVEAEGALGRAERFEAGLGEAGRGQVKPGRAAEDAVRRDFALLTGGELLALDWRRDVFGMMKSGLKTPMAHLLKLEPGKRAPRHAHGRSDVTVVLQGAFTDEYGLYERGDLTFAGPGMRHTPEAVGDETCVCLIATEPGRPIRGFLGLFGIMGTQQEKRSHAD